MVPCHITVDDEGLSEIRSLCSQRIVRISTRISVLIKRTLTTDIPRGILSLFKSFLDLRYANEDASLITHRNPIERWLKIPRKPCQNLC